jgi:predicted ATPase
MRKLMRLFSDQRRYASWGINFSNFLEASLISRFLDEGLQAIDNATKYLEHPGQWLFDSEIQRLHGELILAKDDSRESEVERHFQLAIDIARRQSAKSLELREVMSLAQLWQRMGKRENAQRILADCCGWFSEGFKTADLVAAKELLRELE